MNINNQVVEERRRGYDIELRHSWDSYGAIYLCVYVDGVRLNNEDGNVLEVLAQMQRAAPTIRIF